VSTRRLYPSMTLPGGLPGQYRPRITTAHGEIGREAARRFGKNGNDRRAVGLRVKGNKRVIRLAAVRPGIDGQPQPWEGMLAESGPRVNGCIDWRCDKRIAGDVLGMIRGGVQATLTPCRNDLQRKVVGESAELIRARRDVCSSRFRLADRCRRNAGRCGRIGASVSGV